MEAGSQLGMVGRVVKILGMWVGLALILLPFPCQPLPVTQSLSSVSPAPPRHHRPIHLPMVSVRFFEQKSRPLKSQPFPSLARARQLSQSLYSLVAVVNYHAAF